MNLVNTLGGIRVNAARELCDTCNLPQASAGYCFFGSGLNQMDGATMLWYVRSRGAAGDFDRTRRAQEVLRALFEKLISLDAVRKPSQFFSNLSGTIETDLSIENILPFIPLAVNLRSELSDLRQFFIRPS